MEFKVGQNLYASARTGKVKVWICSVREEADGTAFLTITNRTGLDAKGIVREEHITQGKNLGKSNETTPYQQAVSEAESRYRKKMDQGYRTEIPKDTSKAGANTLGHPKPMLAHPIDKVKNVEFPAFFQAKLDGHRAIVTKVNGEMLMYSRQGKRIDTMGHVLDFLSDRVQDGQYLDGELYLHGEALQNIGSLIKRYQPDSENVRYWAYDMIMPKPFAERTQLLREIVRGHLTSGEANAHSTPARYLPTMPVTSMEAAMNMHSAMVSVGYEGGILRTPDEGYVAGFRSRNLLKIKSFDDDEFTILGVIEGKDRNVNGLELKVAIFQLETNDGKPFEVLAPGTMHDKDQAWYSRNDLIGKRVTVKYMGFTKDGIPWHPVALRIREDV